jgi:hypothetical protein
MSIIAILRIPGNPADLEKYASGPGGDLMKQVSGAGKAAGAIRHTFAGGEGEILVIDEWPDEKSFSEFFDNQAEIADIMRDGGAQGPPEFSFYRKLDTPDQF